MTEIQVFYKKQLDNAYHNAFMDQVLILANEQDFHEPKIAEATAALQDAFTREDENFKIPQASELSPQIAAADNARREGYIHLKTIVNDWAKTPYTPQGPSAQDQESARQIQPQVAHHAGKALRHPHQHH